MAPKANSDTEGLARFLAKLYNGAPPQGLLEIKLTNKRTGAKLELPAKRRRKRA